MLYVSDLPNISLCVSRCGVESMMCVSLVITQVLSIKVGSDFQNFVVNVSELTNIAFCVLRCGVRSTISVSLVARKVFSETVVY